MGNSEKISRRRFIAIAGIATSSFIVLQNCTYPHFSWRFFTIEEARLVDTIADQIIPADDWPGGKQSGVTNFIDKQLVGPYSRYQSTYRNGLRLISNTCKKLYNKNFEELLSAQQITFLETMEAGKLENTGFEPGFAREFFNLICDHTMQSYYGSSRHGGNKNNLSYKMLSLDYPLIIGQNRYKS